MSFTNDDELDLAWFCLSAEADCGMRSTLGGQLSAIEASAFAPGTPQTSTVWMAKPKRAFCQREADEDRILKAAERERAVRARMQQLPHHLQVVLELQYGDAVVIDKESRISLSLASTTRSATDSHEQACAKARKKGKAVEASVRSWVLWLVASTNEGAKEWLAKIVAEAKTDLGEAKAAYGATAGKKVVNG